MRATTFAAALVLALPLAACFTPRVEPKVSQAVLDARAHRNLAPTGCDASAAPSPLSTGFAFNETALSPGARDALDLAAHWLGCHPQALAVVKGAADAHGTPAEQAALANRRVDAAVGYLTAHGVQSARIRRLGSTDPEPAGEHLLILAEGQRW